MKVLSTSKFFLIQVVIIFSMMMIFSTVCKADSYKTTIGTCWCGIDDYKCDNGFGSCNVHSQSICEYDCEEHD